MSNGPYADDTLEQLRAGAGHLVRAVVTTPDGAYELPVIGGQLGFDERRTPMVTARIVIALPAALGMIAQLDPRIGVRVALYAGYDRLDGAHDVAALVDLAVSDAEADYTTEQLTLTAASDEQLILDNAYFATSSLIRADTRSFITAVIGQVITAPTFVDLTTTAGPALNELIGPGADRWDIIAMLAERLGIRVYCPGDRIFYLVPNNKIDVGHPSYQLSLDAGPDGLLTGLRQLATRDDWANAVQLIYQWRNPSTGVETVIIGKASITTGAYAAVKGLTSDYTELRQSNITQASADQQAAGVLYRRSRRGRSFEAAGPALYWLRPLDFLNIRRPSSDLSEGVLVSNVTFDLGAGTMTLQTTTIDV